MVWFTEAVQQEHDEFVADCDKRARLDSVEVRASMSYPLSIYYLKHWHV